MDGSANELLCFMVWPLQIQQWVLLCNCLVGVLQYSHYTMRYNSPCAELGFSTPHMIEIDNHHYGRHEKKTTVPWFSSSRTDWHILQRSCQPTPTPIHILYFTASVPTEANCYICIKGAGGDVICTLSQSFNHLPRVPFETGNRCCSE